MKNYLGLMARVLNDGEARSDRTGVGTTSLWGEVLRFDLSMGFPATTTKRLAFRQVCAELTCFLRAYEWLEEFHSVNCTVWDANASAKYWRDNPHCAGDGHVGRTYGVQWRRWFGPSGRIDQLRTVAEMLRDDPHTRRAVVTAWNPAELDASCLPPCHHAFQFGIRAGRRLSCFVTMRSVDVFLGMPFDIASYALLTHLMARTVGAHVGELVMTFGDCHVYRNHVMACTEQLTRPPKRLPWLRLDDAATIDNFHPSMAELLAYDPHPPIAAEMNV